MVKKFKDSPKTLAHDGFQRWRRSNPTGLFINCKSEKNWMLHRSRPNSLLRSTRYRRDDGSACSTHFRSDDSVRSRSRAAAPTVFPSSSTRRMAPALNSSVKLRRVRFRFVSDIVDIVSAFRIVSTQSDQAQVGAKGFEPSTLQSRTECSTRLRTWPFQGQNTITSAFARAPVARVTSP